MSRAEALAKAQSIWGSRIARVRVVRRTWRVVGFMVWSPTLGRDRFEPAGSGPTWERAFSDARIRDGGAV